MKKIGILFVFIFLLVSCYREPNFPLPSFNENLEQSNIITEGNKDEFMKKINLANDIYLNSQSNIELFGSFNEQINEQKTIKEDGMFEILLAYKTYKQNNKKVKEIEATSFIQSFYSPSKRYTELLECYISGPFLYQHIKNYDNQNIFLETKQAEVIVKNNIIFLKDYISFMPFDINNFLAKKITFYVKNQNIYGCKIEIDSSSAVDKNLIMYYDIEFEFYNGFYKSINYKRYYNSNLYPIFNMNMNVALSVDSIDYPADLADYTFGWEK